MVAQAAAKNEVRSDQYEQYLADVYVNGTHKEDRTGTGTRSVFGRQMRFDLQQGFPLVTTKKVAIKAVIHELLWFLSGSTNIKYLKDNGVSIWDAWADENGDLGPVYGSQWRKWPGIPSLHEVDASKGVKGNMIMMTPCLDQISQLMRDLKHNPDSRRLIVSAWNVAEIPNMKLPPCHMVFQFYTTELTLAERDDLSELKEQHRGTTIFGNALCGDKKSIDASHIMFDEQGVPRRKLSCQLYQRSVDSVLGLPFNIASYAFLTHMIAQQLNMIAAEFVWTGGDCHIYDSHVSQVQEQLSREPYAYPTLRFSRKPNSIFDYKIEDFEIVNYQHHPAIKAPVSV